MEQLSTYKSLYHTCRMIRAQVIDSMPYVGEFIPKYIQTPEQLFDYFKNVVTYVDDNDLSNELFGYSSEETEFIMTVQTFMKYGARGDCDDFTVLMLACCIYLGYEKNIVCLVGNHKDAPTHIYPGTYVKNLMGNFYPVYLDLTNSVFDHERNYKYKQTLNFEI